MILVKAFEFGDQINQKIRCLRSASNIKEEFLQKVIKNGILYVKKWNFIQEKQDIKQLIKDIGSTHLDDYFNRWMLSVKTRFI